MAAQPLLRGVARTSKSPQARVLAAWLLKGVDRLDDGTIGALLRADHPRVREHGALLAEDRIAANDSLQEAVLALARERAGRESTVLAELLAGETLRAVWDRHRVL